MNPINLDNVKAQLDLDGYAIIPSFIKDVDQFRSLCDRYFDNSETLEMTSKDLIGEAFFAEILTHPFLIELYQNIFGESPILYPNVTIRKNVYTPWHIDRGFIKTHKHTKDIDISAFQFGVYMQEGDIPILGELEVRKKSQNILKHCPFKNVLLVDIYCYLASMFFTKVTLSESQAGDLFIWDRRLFHRAATKPTTDDNQKSKYAMYWSVSSNQSTHAKHYLKHLFGRSKKSQNLVAKHASQSRYRQLEELNFFEAFCTAQKERLSLLITQRKLKLGQS